MTGDVLTALGWRALKRMLLPDLIQASRELPRATRDEVVRRANEIHFSADQTVAAVRVSQGDGDEG